MCVCVFLSLLLVFCVVVLGVGGVRVSDSGLSTTLDVGSNS